ncbi:putative UPF0481 protein At3g02645 isoform X2 [Olea europaea var. sylvestris]|uniref:putative UPF0481 protein At3g02645 isoform X1 n=1 Tax=Olea europaea var. sylvestris TaxID=158386 RepID=UPI000C1D4982|nr:putative UPF0481 protein At3g02645 isoform X1 [Olea europaea var. sylvestris]XP_022850350.1 putative UPF0481 protein At3g02645 isoform X2 [Olea europaea var. sylvestris]
MNTISSFHSSAGLGIGSNIDEGRWVAYIRQALEEELEEETQIPASIFNVPKPLLLSDPDSYIPQEVAIGPYHCFRPELYNMEKYKLAAAQRNQREIPNKKLEYLVDQYLKFEFKIRAYYLKPINYSGETLAWMMLVDASFLFEFLQVYAVGKGKVPTNVPSRMSHLIELAANKAANNAIFKDILKVENQIPLFVLRELLEFQFPSLELADQWLLSMLLGLSKDLSPFKMVQEFPKIQLMDCAHLLDFAYRVIVPKLEEQSHDHHRTEIEEDGESKEGEKDSFTGELDGESKEGEKDSFTGEPSYVRRLVNEVWNILSKLGKEPVQWIKSVIFSKILIVLVKLPWTIISKVPVLYMLKQPLEQVFSASHNEGEKKENEDSDSNGNTEKPPLIEEIKIPSVIDLFEVGVCFMPTNEGIQSINFDVKTATLYLPIISVDVNSEIVLRNMVAYEACRASRPMVLTRYTELMNGIIDTEKDASFLRERGIIINSLKSDKEVADLWNGMSKSIRLTKVSFIDQVIVDVNKYYSGMWKVKCGKFMNKYIYGSWQILTFLAAIMMLLLMCLQAFCQVFGCRRIFPVKALEPVVTY